jgi:3D (Asp-Asp-Asp) domain-containing protein
MYTGVAAAALVMCIGSFTTCYEDYAVQGSCEVTAYTNSADEVKPFHDGFTASMMPADHELRIIAVDLKKIPLFSQVHVEGLGWFLAGDTGGAIKGERIDVLMANKTSAFKYGREKKVRTRIVPPSGECSWKQLREIWSYCHETV